MITYSSTPYHCLVLYPVSCPYILTCCFPSTIGSIVCLKGSKLLRVRVYANLMESLANIKLCVHLYTV